MRHGAPLASALLLVVLGGAAAEDPQTLAKRAIASVKRQPTWGPIEILMATAKDYAIILNYKSTPSDMPVVEHDLSTIARALIQTLVAAGHKPPGEEIYIRVDGFTPVTGETGATDAARIAGVAGTRAQGTDRTATAPSSRSTRASRDCARPAARPAGRPADGSSSCRQHRKSTARRRSRALSRRRMLLRARAGDGSGRGGAPTPVPRRRAGMPLAGAAAR